MLANLAGFDEKERIAPDQMPELERYMLARLAELDAQVRAGYARFDFNSVTSALFTFCTNELSAFYFDIRKDVLYCDAAQAVRRRAARTVMDEAFRRIVTWFAPILCFTMEEAWLTRFPGDNESVHLQSFLEMPQGWANAALIEKWTRIRELRKVITGALELERAAKKIGSSLEAAPTLYLADEADADLLASVAMAEVAITSGVTVLAVAAPQDAFTLPDVKGASVAATLASGLKCARCWMVLEEVKAHPSTHLCDRCTAAVAAPA